ncbi:unnamed protein product [Soboliphyme baturini]|uniref:Transmembrane protein n=1 Tax=Soboliphyme baturini TaxID=241478 RepID=A0A183J2H6_9BILA|nr:unnamed protein product [Soboliphyme baturini]
MGTGIVEDTNSTDRPTEYGSTDAEQMDDFLFLLACGFLSVDARVFYYVYRNAFSILLSDYPVMRIVFFFLIFVVCHGEVNDHSEIGPQH